MDISEMNIMQIVGYKNTGKTTLVEALITYLRKKNKQVGTIKHHGHGGEPDKYNHTDSTRHLDAGSIVTTVQGKKETHITLKEKDALTIDKLLEFYKVFPVDNLLIEGYKQANFPKVLLIKTIDELYLLEGLTNIIAVGVMDEALLEKAGKMSSFVFPLIDTVKYLPQLIECITVNRDKGS